MEPTTILLESSFAPRPILCAHSHNAIQMKKLSPSEVAAVGHKNLVTQISEVTIFSGKNLDDVRLL